MILIVLFGNPKERHVLDQLQIIVIGHCNSPFQNGGHLTPRKSVSERQPAHGAALHKDARGLVTRLAGFFGLPQPVTDFGKRLVAIGVV